MSGLVFGPRPQLILGALAIIFGRRDGTRRLWNFEGGDYGPFASFTRSGAGTAFTTAGMIQTFASNVPRVTDKGLLLEGAATNILPRYAPAAGQVSKTGEVLDVTAPAIAPIVANWISITPASGNNGSATQGAAIQTATPYVFQCLVETPDDAAPLVGSSSAAFNFSIVVGNSIVPPPISIKKLVGRVWLVSGSTTQGTLTNHGIYKYIQQPYRALKYSGWQLELGTAPSSPIITTGTAAARGAESAALTVPAGCTKWQAVYGDASTVASGSGLVPGGAFDLVAGRPWVGLGNELKSVRFAP